MNNLKRVLSVGLTGAMLAGMMVVGASAADFKDADEIEHTDAVNTLVALNVINGKDDGSYDPNGIVTRAEMAKLITVALNGGKDPVLGTKTTPSYTDIDGHWAESYIEYCSNLSIINGRGDGTFAPDATVTGSEAAKMMLVAMGWDSTIFNFTGADWAINVAIEANKVDLYEDLEDVDVNAGLTRDDTAQLIFNGILAPMMVKAPSMEITNGNITWRYELDEDVSIFTEKFKGEKVDGILTYDPATGLDDEGVYTYTVDDKEYEIEADYTDLFMLNVEVLYKEDSNGNVDKVYGIYAKDNNILATGVVDDLALVSTSDTKIKVGSTTYNLSDETSAINIVAFLGTTVDTLNDLTTYTNNGTEENIAYEIKLIDNDNDKKGDVIVVYPFTVAEVTYVGSKSFSANGSHKFDEVNVYDGIKEGDWVKITDAANTADNTEVIEKLAVVVDTAEAIKKSDNLIKFDGEWLDTTITGAVATAGDECTYVAVNGYLFHLESTSNKLGADDFVLVTAAATKTAGLDNTQTVKVLKADGTVAQVEVSKVGGTNVTDDSDAPVLATVGTLYTFDEDDDGYYELTSVSTLTDDDVSYDGVSTSAAFTGASGNTSGYVTIDSSKTYIDDDAVVFVKKSGTSYAVSTGAALKATKTANVTSVTFTAYSEDGNSGYNYVQLAYVDSASLGKVVSTYGYVTGDVVKYESDGDYYVEIPVGDETLVTTTNSTVVNTAYGLKKGDIFTYELNGSGKVSKITKYDMKILSKTGDIDVASGEVDFYAAIAGYADDDIRFTNVVFTDTDTVSPGSSVYNTTLTDDTVIIYVDASGSEIEEGGRIRLAGSEDVSGKTVYYANAKAVVDAATQEILLLVVDVNNDILDIQ